MANVYGQEGFDLRFDWGYKGVRDAAERGNVVVIVDVLSFSTAVATAIAHGATIYPFPMKDQKKAAAFAKEVGAEVKTETRVESITRRALSPLSFTNADRGKNYVLCSPNGAHCSRIARPAPGVVAGAVVNAQAAGRTAQALAETLGASITVIACGERWKDAAGDEDVLRPCLEDYLGSGAILAGMEGEMSPEAEVAAAAFWGANDQLEDILWDCASGRELREMGHGDDVEFSAQLNRLTEAPVLRGEQYIPAGTDE